jgi:hypothetical protein
MSIFEKPKYFLEFFIFFEKKGTWTFLSKIENRKDKIKIKYIIVSFLF